MTQEARIPKKMWFTPLPNPPDPWAGGAILNVLTSDDEQLKIGLSLTGLLNLQFACSKLLGIIVVSSFPDEKPAGNPITETEIEAFVKQLDTTPEEGNTNE